MVVFPNAKINLGLYVLRRRQDNYHDIETLMVGVDWCDILEIVPSSSHSDRLTCTGLKVDCPAEKNLVMKAVCRLREAGLNVPSIDIYLHKNIPDGAGLGGGSSDASFTILCLNQLFGLGLSKESMVEIAATIGSDCPFFIYNSPMIASGRGEILNHFNSSYLESLKNHWIIIIKLKDTSVSTAEAYSGVKPCIPERKIEEILNIPPDRWQHLLFNDFEDSVFSIKPEIHAVKEELIQKGAIYASMSGSGSAVFGIFANKIDISELKLPATSFIHEGKLIM